MALVRSKRCCCCARLLLLLRFYCEFWHSSLLLAPISALYRQHQLFHRCKLFLRELSMPEIGLLMMWNQQCKTIEMWNFCLDGTWFGTKLGPSLRLITFIHVIYKTEAIFFHVAVLLTSFGCTDFIFDWNVLLFKHYPLYIASSCDSV